MTTPQNNGGGGDDDADAPPASGAPKGPITDTMRKPQLKRFYNAASAGEGGQILLDGRAVKTPKKRALKLPTPDSAAAVAAEWAAQGGEINPGSMPLTRFANTAIDAVADTLDAVAADIVAYAGRDLLCYRAKTPPELALQQAASWDPVVRWASETLHAHFVVVTGVMPVDQPPATLQKIAKTLEPHDAFRLTALHVMTTLTGSALLALADARGFLSASQAWSAAHIDEDYQIALWGQDEEAQHRRRLRTAEFDAASTFLTLLG
jgi:chaperone required for assembly of F1-ATPase